MPQAVIVGGGPVGLATAALLARGGLKVTLCERNGTVGGRAAPLTSKGYTFDSSPWFLSPGACEAFFALFGRKLDDYVDLLEPSTRLRAFFEEGHDVPSSILELDADAHLNWDRIDEIASGDGESARQFVLQAAREGQIYESRLGHVPIRGAYSLCRPMTLRHLPWLARHLMMSLGGVASRSINHPRIQQLVCFPALGLTGSPQTTPRAYSYLSYDILGDVIRHPKGGMGSIVTALARLAGEEGATIRLQSDVARVLVDPDSRLATGVVLRTGEVLSADLVVSCVDRHHTETSLLPPEFVYYPESSWAKKSASPSALIVAVEVRKPLPELAHHNIFFPSDFDRFVKGLQSVSTENPFASEFLYVGRPTATDPSMAPKGKESLIVILPLPADPSLGADEASRRSLTDLAIQILDQIGVQAGITNLRKRSKIASIVTPSDMVQDYGVWRGSGVGLTPTWRGLIASGPRGASRRISNLLYSDSGVLPGVGLPGAYIAAELTAKSVLGRMDPLPLSSPTDTGFLRSSLRRDSLGETLRSIVNPVVD